MLNLMLTEESGAAAAARQALRERNTSGTCVWLEIAYEE